MVTPFGMTPVWYACYAEALSAGRTRGAAAEIASRTCGTQGKGFARCRLHTGILGIPVEGGSGVLKRMGADPVISGHGKWRREHLGAWNAAYGRTPFYVELMPEIEAIYSEPEGMRLEEFNQRLLSIAERWLRPEEMMESRAERFMRKREEVTSRIRSELSIFDAIFRLGKESLYFE